MCVEEIAKILTLFVKKIIKNKKTDKIENKLKGYLDAMTILDIIMIPEKKKYLRLINYSKENSLEKYIIDNGKGDFLTIYFSGLNVMIKGFDHENEFNQLSKEEIDTEFFENIYSVVPDEFRKILTKEEIYETTFVTYCSINDGKWIEKSFQDNDGGKNYLLKYIMKTADDWCNWAKDYYEKDFDIQLVEKIYNNEFNEDIIKLLNPDCDISETLKLIKNIK